MSTPRPIKVLVVHDDPLVDAGLLMTLREQPGFEAVAALALADVVVADYAGGLRFAASGGPDVLVVTTRQSEREIRHALERGVRGYLVQGCGLAELVAAVRALHGGLRHVGTLAAERLADSVCEPPLTGRETDVLRLLVQGHGNKTIAFRLAIAPGTVKSHLKTIFHKLGANSRTEAAAVAERRGLLALPADAMQRPLAWSPGRFTRPSHRPLPPTRTAS